MSEPIAQPPWHTKGQTCSHDRLVGVPVLKPQGMPLPLQRHQRPCPPPAAAATPRQATGCALDARPGAAEQACPAPSPLRRCAHGSRCKPWKAVPAAQPLGTRQARRPLPQRLRAFRFLVIATWLPGVVAWAQHQASCCLCGGSPRHVQRAALPLVPNQVDPQPAHRPSPTAAVLAVTELLLGSAQPRGHMPTPRCACPQQWLSYQPPPARHLCLVLLAWQLRDGTVQH